MLCQFSFKNYKSYRDETVFDFQATSVPEFEDTLIATDHSSDVLPISVVYGPNGGGKSNLLQALCSVISIVVSPVKNLEKTLSSIILQQKINPEPYLFNDYSKNEPTEFQLFFRTKHAEYRYCLSILGEAVVFESLHKKTFKGKKPAKLFTRKNDIIEVGASLARENIYTNVAKTMPFLSFLAITYSLPVIDDVMEWFESCIIRNYANYHTENRFIVDEDIVPHSVLTAMLNDIGIEISGYEYDKEKKTYTIYHTIDGVTYELPFLSESNGTRKLFVVLPVIYVALREGRLVIVDELDAKLHPMLLRYVIKLFTNKQTNPKGAQLLFTSHDMATMKNSLFRRDEIWFAALNESKCSELYSLYDIRTEQNQHINNTAAYDKQYLEGRYGADPYLKAMMSWGQNNA